MFSLSQYDELLDAVYDLPWYEWPSDERKSLCLIIASLQTPPRIRGVVDELTFEWLAGFFKASYSFACTMAKFS